MVINIAMTVVMIYAAAMPSNTLIAVLEVVDTVVVSERAAGRSIGRKY